MADEHLADCVRQRANEDPHLSDEARSVVLAAFGDSDGSPAVFLTSLAVQGLRGVGPEVTVAFRPDPGLVVIAGPNGSGKSTLAGALELALTGSSRRSGNWRNLHFRGPALVRLMVSGETTIGVDWAAGHDVVLSDLCRWVQRAGQEPAHPDVLGWLGAPMYRRVDPSASYELPGLEQLDAAMNQLDAQVNALRKPSWQLTTPDVDEVSQACASLRAAATAQADAERAADALAADRVAVLETGLLFHQRHGTQPCPVCLDGTLDDGWAERARAAMAREQHAAQSLMTTRSASYRSRQALVGIVRAVPAPPAEDVDLPTIAAARHAYRAFSALPVDDDPALADHVEATLPDLLTAYGALRQEVDLVDRRAVAVDEHAASTMAEARDWLQQNADAVRDERIRSLADRVQAIWAALRQESQIGVELRDADDGRGVVLRASVDGSEVEALSVLSEGELQALALALFIPRATAAESPFRFVVLDDPSQAMDRSTMEGLVYVLVTLAAERQVVVFTHDERLLNAIRRCSTPVRILEVSRAHSVVALNEVDSPAE